LPRTRFTTVPWEGWFEGFVQGLIRVRRDLYVDPLLNDPWRCNPARCRPRLGRNLCCKVEVRCRHLRGTRCAIHDRKPFGCALFPLDLVRSGAIRVVTTVKNPEFFRSGWSRYHRDMLRCFDGIVDTDVTMFEAQRTVLGQVLGPGELNAVERALRRDRAARCREFSDGIVSAPSSRTGLRAGRAPPSTR